MRTILCLALLLSCTVCGRAADPERFDSSKFPKRLKRSDSFLGIHFDFHAGDDCTEIGRNTTRDMVEKILRKVKPDYIQVDCKGHRGLSSYPTRVGNPAPGFVGDPLCTWRQVTAERGVALFLHYSGVWDNEAVAKHPEWARIGPDGKPDPQKASVFGSYVDDLLIPQLKELGDVYGVDGVWVDGECWAVLPDYGEAALKAFREATGITDVPHKREDPHWLEFMQFNREAFRQYVRHYVDELHRHNPDFQLTSNWAFSDHMPEPVTIGLDYLSGDYSPQNSVNSARFSARCIAPQGRPWDLMAWAFTGSQSDVARPLKTIPQLQQEAAVVLAQGGGFQAYFQQKRDGSIRDWQMDLMAAVGAFCRERQELCHRSEAVPQIALLYSMDGHYRQSGSLFHPSSPGVTSLRGVLNGLLHLQYSVDIRSEHHLRGRLKDYPAVVIPGWDYLNPGFRSELVDYVRNGGNLLLAGPAAAGLFREELGAEWLTPETAGPVYLAQDGWLAGLKTPWLKVRTGGGLKPIGRLYLQDDFKSDWWPAATVRVLGKGRIGALWFGFGETYNTRRTATARDFLGAVVKELFPEPMVEVRGSHAVDVSLQRKEGRLLVNLVNTSGPHEDESVYTIGEVDPLGPLEVTLRLKERPRKITLEPGGDRLPFRYRGGKASVRVEQLDIHVVVAVEP